MSKHPPSWAELSQPQTSFLRNQVEAAADVLFSPVAHSAGIFAINGSRIDINLEDTVYQSVTWPDAYGQNAFCFLASAGEHKPTYFARIQHPTQDQLYIQGIGLGGIMGKSLYSEMAVMPTANEVSIERIGAKFMLAVNRERHIRQIANPAISNGLAQPNKPNVRMEGITSQRVGRLFRSLNALGSNLAVTGETAQQIELGSRTFDLARGFLKLAIESVREERISGRNISGSKGVGAVFESNRYGLTCAVQNDAQSILLTTAPRPQLGEELSFMDIHRVMPAGVTSSFNTLPEEAYNPETFMHCINDDDSHPHPTGDFMDRTGVKMVDQKLLNLLVEVSGY